MLRTILIIAAILFASVGCGPKQEPSKSVAPARPAFAEEGGALRVQDKGRPEITIQGISKDVVGWVVEVGEINGAQPSTEWTFEANEYRHIDILERHTTASGVDLLVFMLTRTNPKAQEEDVQVAGQLRLHYEWKGNKWVLRKIDNVSFRYSLGVAT
jgi:hypothetical protein